ncbi:MAG: L,D-transpeptidase [Verrucomicrobiota bacterium]
MHINVATTEQQLTVHDGDVVIATYPVSTSKFGLGESEGSHQTPRGHHIITEKIGADATSGTIFKGRIPTGETWTPEVATEKDLILTRILWLSGEEPHNVNSHDRYIYFHGTNQEHLIGTPASIGCIRLTNADIISLFDQVEVGTPVTIF